MEEIDMIICLKKKTITKRISKNLWWSQAIKIKKFDSFSFHCKKKWNKKSYISEKMVLLKVLFIKIKNQLTLMK